MKVDLEKLQEALRIDRAKRLHEESQAETVQWKQRAVSILHVASLAREYGCVLDD